MDVVQEQLVVVHSAQHPESSSCKNIAKVDAGVGTRSMSRRGECMLGWGSTDILIKWPAFVTLSIPPAERERVVRSQMPNAS
ncbi:hypothetical protein BLNAU_6905 [Blattamonas nauphoetae]|uniref:Uncharacterized protein n=1 Tax=Blattamonas nauphoetae TaxID=2049346 RepID=A0ABQ9Y389_9EUKA|nr:hypothetical protein BLNAU_6905 [Blattamonas nauphoetae]